MPCWACKLGILAALIALIALLAQVAAAVALVANAMQALLFALSLIGINASPLVLTSIISIVVGFSANDAAEYVCCKLGVVRCCAEG
jgi:hypothetical protein